LLLHDAGRCASEAAELAGPTARGSGPSWRDSRVLLWVVAPGACPWPPTGGLGQPRDPRDRIDRTDASLRSVGSGDCVTGPPQPGSSAVRATGATKATRRPFVAFVSCLCCECDGVLGPTPLRSTINVQGKRAPQVISEDPETPPRDHVPGTRVRAGL